MRTCAVLRTAYYVRINIRLNLLEPTSMRKSAVIAVTNDATDDKSRRTFTRTTDALTEIHDFDCLVNFGTPDDWEYASSNIALPEAVIRQASNKVNWSGICKYQDVSHELLMEFRDRINIHALFYSKFIKYETVCQFFCQLKKSQLGAPRRPTRAIKRVIRQNRMLQLLRFKNVPLKVLQIISKYLGSNE